MIHVLSLLWNALRQKLYDEFNPPSFQEKSICLDILWGLNIGAMHRDR